MKTNRSHCPLVNAIDIIGDKWSLVIVRDLFLGKTTFTEFMKSPEKIASNILTNRLELLMSHDLLSVTKLPQDNKTKVYYLTNKGIDLYPIMYEMMCWSQRNLVKDFGPIGSQFFKDIKGFKSENFIKDAQTTYTAKRDALLKPLHS